MRSINAGTAAEHLSIVAKRLFARLGVRVMQRKNLSHPLDRRRQFLGYHNIDLVIDVGANAGQYAQIIRELGYKGRIVSFEPMSDPFVRLSAAARKDDYWEVCRLGLGNQKETQRIHIAGNSIGSSLLPMNSLLETASPHSRYIGSEEIEVDLLDNVFPTIRGAATRIWLKLDVQGFEDRVLDGAQSTLNEIRAIQIELSLRPLYDGQVLYDEFLRRLGSLGFRLADVEPVFWDKTTGELLAMDGIFIRT